MRGIFVCGKTVIINQFFYSRRGQTEPERSAMISEQRWIGDTEGGSSQDRPWVVAFSHPPQFPLRKLMQDGDLEAVLGRLGCVMAPIPERDPYDPEDFTDVRRMLLVDPDGQPRGDLTWSTRSTFSTEDLLYLLAAIIQPAD